MLGFPRVSVFENVESYACNEAMPDDVEVYRTVSPTVSPENYTCFDRSKVYDVYDAEDEIQLYFRPQGGKRRRRKGVN